MGLNNRGTANPFDSNGTPSQRVVRIVAWLEGVDETTLPPLQEVVDADALDRLFDVDRRDDVEVTFEFEGYELRVERGGAITVGDVDRSVSAALPRGTNALVLTRSDDRYDEACNDLLTASPHDATPCDHANVLGITFDSAGANPLDRWNFGANEPRRTGLITVGDFCRSTGSSSPSSPGPSPPSPSSSPSADRAPPSGRVKRDCVDDPTDLQALGMQINERLSSWDAPDAQSFVCFSSLSELLEVAELKRLFRFLHLLNGWLTSKGVISHFHLDARRADERTLGMLQPVFDVSFEVDEDGAWALHLP